MKVVEDPAPQAMTKDVHNFGMSQNNMSWQNTVSVKYALSSGLGLGGLERHGGLYSKPMIILDFLVESFMPLHGT